MYVVAFAPNILLFVGPILHCVQSSRASSEAETCAVDGPHTGAFFFQSVKTVQAPLLRPKDVANRLGKEEVDTLERITKLRNIHDVLVGDLDIARRTFLPGWHGVPMRVIWTACLTASAATVWLIFFTRHVYKTDRVTYLNLQTPRPDKKIAASIDLVPDMIIVFEHPDASCQATHYFEPGPMGITYDDKGVVEEISPDGQANAKPISKGDQIVKVGAERFSKDAMIKAEKSEASYEVALEVRSCSTESMLSVSSLNENIVFRADSGTSNFPRLEELKGNSDATVSVNSLWGNEEDFELSSRSVTASLIQDLTDQLPKQGFTIRIFTSVDDDKVFLCISIREPKAIEQYLVQYNYHVQVREDIAGKLGIKQPSDDLCSSEDPCCSPPRMRYDRRIVNHLYRTGILEENDPRELYKTDTSMTEEASGGIIVGFKDRFHIIQKEINARLNLHGAKECGLIVDWYPVHHPAQLKLLKDTWSERRSWLSWCADWFVQPIHHVHQYFGARVAFEFVWNGHYCKMLSALIPLAAFLEVFVLLAKFFGIQERNTHQLLGFSIVLVIWSRIAAIQWRRERAFYIEHWHVDPEDKFTKRPQYKGQLRSSKVDARQLEKHYPYIRQLFWRMCSAVITFMSCCLVTFSIYVWMSLFDGKMSAFASFMLALQIKGFELAYNRAVDWLTDLENHESDIGYYDSWLWKQFLFQSVNNYYPFIYIIANQPLRQSGCLDHDCMERLRYCLQITLLMLSGCRIAENLSYFALVRYRIWREDRTIKYEFEGRQIPKRGPAEEQSKYIEFEGREQVQAMLQLVIALGHVLLFGAAAPFVVVLSFILFVVHIQATAHLLTTSAKRVRPQSRPGIGAWEGVLKLLMNMGVASTGALLVGYGESFRDALLLARVVGFGIWCISVWLLWSVMGIFYAKEDYQTHLLIARRRHVLREIFQKAEQSESIDALDEFTYSQSSLLIAGSQEVGIVRDGEWSGLLHLDGSCTLKRYRR